MTVYAADQTTVLASANGAGHYGTTLSLTVNNVTDGQRFYVKVQGADNSALGSGAYALTLNFGTGPSPAVPLPNTTRAVGVIPSGGGGTTTVARVLVGDDTTPPEVVAPDGEPVWDNLTAGDTAGSAVPQGPSGATTPDNLAAGVMLASSGSRTPSAWTDSNNFATGALLDNGTTPTQSGQGQPGSTPSRPHGSGCGCPGCMAALLGYDFYEMTQDTAAGADPGAGQLTADAVLAADPTALLAT